MEVATQSRGASVGRYSAATQCAALAAAAVALSYGWSAWARSKHSSVLQQEIAVLKSKLELDAGQLRAIRDAMIEEMEAGLRERGRPMHMLPTHVAQLPRETDTGDAYAVDLGGTNLRVARVVVREGRLEGEPTIEAREVPKHLLTEPVEHLFDFLAMALERMIARHGDPSRPARVGFSFSFPMEQASVDSGILMYWTKGYACAGAVGKDVVRLFSDALGRAGSTARVVCLVNDCLGPLVAASEPGRPAAAGMIFGTGTNMAYMERRERVVKLEGGGRRGRSEGGMVINSEWANFFSETLPLVEEDVYVDAASHNPGAGRFEKLTSGAFYGEVSRRLIARLQERAHIFGPGEGSPMLGGVGQGSLSAKEASFACGDYSHDLSRVGLMVEGKFGVDKRRVGRKEREAVREVCRLAARRAGFVAAAGAAAVLKKIGWDGKTPAVLGVEGAFYHNTPLFAVTMREGLNKLGCQKAELKPVSGGSVVGTALLAATFPV
ncbi:unnamed protein product [Pedinophyceae sp. YPF-701]|nr:unnamed protein product [Pedinophyceae sp. YPF-701]